MSAKPRSGVNEAFEQMEAQFIDPSNDEDIEKSDGNRSPRPFREEINAEIPITQFRPYTNNPFRLYVDGPDHWLVRDIQEKGVLDRIVARYTLGETNDSGEELYEVISGHNRLKAAEYAGLKTIPACIMTIQDWDVGSVVLSLNKNRREMPPSELGRVFNFGLAAISRQGKRADETSDEKRQKLSRDEIGAAFGVSGSKVRQYIRFAYLIPDFQDVLDNKKLQKGVADDISYLRPSEQEILYGLLSEYKQNLDRTQSSMLKREREKADKANLTDDLSSTRIMEILNSEEEDKASFVIKRPKNIKLPYERFEKYLGKHFEGKKPSEEELCDALIEMLERSLEVK